MAVISVLLLSEDSEYSRRICRYVSKKYPDIRFSVLEKPDNVDMVVVANACSIILADEIFIDDIKKRYPDLAIGCLTVNEPKREIEGVMTFCRYKSVDTLYKILLNMYSEVSRSKAIITEMGSNIYAFVGAGGGTGTTLAAISYAVRMATSGRNVLYVNLGRFTKTSDILGGEVTGDMSDILTAVITAERRSINLPAKVAALSVNGYSGVKYIENCMEPTDLDDLTEERFLAFITALKAANYDLIILDISANDPVLWKFSAQNAAKIIVTASDGELGKSKFERFVRFVGANEAHGFEVSSKICVVVNKCRQRNLDAAGYTDKFKIAGCIPMYTSDSSKEIIGAIRRLEMWNNV